MKIQIKPLSVNDAWQGRRFKTPLYKSYEEELLLRLSGLNLPHPPFWLDIEVGFSNKGSDLSNILKPFEDILQKKYNFNDKEIYKISMIKKIVGKGEEFIKFEIKSL